MTATAILWAHSFSEWVTFSVTIAAMENRCDSIRCCTYFVAETLPKRTGNCSRIRSRSLWTDLNNCSPFYLCILCVVRLHAGETKNDRVQPAGSYRIGQSPRETIQGEEDVGYSQRGLCVEMCSSFCKSFCWAWVLMWDYWYFLFRARMALPMELESQDR